MVCVGHGQRVLEGHLAGERGHPVRMEIHDGQLPKMMPEMSVRNKA